MSKTKRYLAGTAGMLLVLLAAGPAFAQIRPQFELAFAMGFPQGEFRDNVDNVGFGINGFVGIGLGNSPLVVGADLGVLVYGFERRREPFSNTIPDVRVDVETSNNIFLGHIVVRAQPPGGRVRPYLDGLFGMKYFFTETSIKDRRGDDAIASTTNFDDAALSYGAGGGINVEVYRGNKSVHAVLINAGARYLVGTQAEYLREGSIERRNGEVFYDTVQSETNMLVTQFGVTLLF